MFPVERIGSEQDLVMEYLSCTEIQANGMQLFSVIDGGGTPYLVTKMFVLSFQETGIFVSEEMPFS